MERSDQNDSNIPTSMVFMWDQNGYPFPLMFSTTHQRNLLQAKMATRLVRVYSNVILTEIGSNTRCFDCWKRVF